MNKEEFIGKLQMCYFGERNAFEEIVSVYEELIKENKKLKEKLEKCIPISEQVETINRKNKRIEELKKENEMLHHYKLLYQKVKDRNDKAIDFLENHRSGSDWYDTRDLLDILKGNNEGSRYESRFNL